MCHAKIPSQSSKVGACANSQGHGMLHLQTSNQSPEAFHFGTLFFVVTEVVAVVVVAAISLNIRASLIIYRYIDSFLACFQLLMPEVKESQRFVRR
jgi:hypothetical protein